MQQKFYSHIGTSHTRFENGYCHEKIHTKEGRDIEATRSRQHMSGEVVTNKIKEGIVKRSKASKLPETFLVRPNRLFSSCQNSVVITVFGSKMS